MGQTVKQPNRWEHPVRLSGATFSTPSRTAPSSIQPTVGWRTQHVRGTCHASRVLLIDVVTVSSEVGAASSRLAKVARIADLLRATERDGDARDVAVVVSGLSGELPQRQIGVGWASLKSLPAPAGAPSLVVSEVDATLSEIGAVAGKGSQ